MRHPTWLLIPAAVVSTAAYGTTYLSLEQAQAAIFPGAQLTAAFVTLTKEQVSAIEKNSGVNVRKNEVKLWKSSDGGYFIVDEVVGKHEFITYAVGLNADGTVKQIEILTYRESYGYEVRNADWRAQFVGKDKTAPLKLDHDIKNISGATLSSAHISAGVRRVLQTYELLKTRT